MLYFCYSLVTNQYSPRRSLLVATVRRAGAWVSCAVQGIEDETIEGLRTGFVTQPTGVSGTFGAYTETKFVNTNPAAAPNQLA